jgi:hypothetical protein
VRSRLIGDRTAVINQLRGFLLEHGIAVRQGHRFLRQQLPQILATRADVLSPRMTRIIGDLVEDWAHLDERIETVTHEIEGLARADVSCVWDQGNTCSNRPHRTAPLESDQHIISRSAIVLYVTTPQVTKVLTSSVLSESCTKIGDVPKSPVSIVAALVPSVGT